jgi:hypothetical protein
MQVKEIKESLKDFAHIKQVWVKNGEYYLVPIKGAELVNLHEVKEVEIVSEIQEEETKSTKKSKK